MYDMGIDAFFQKINRRCESCGDEKEDWNIHVNPEGAYGGIPAVTETYQVASVLPVVALSCKSCGYIRLYTAESIQKMIDIQKAMENQPPRMCELEGSC